MVADRCRARTLSVRLRGKVDADGPGALGADAVREVLRIEPIPDFGAARPGIRCLPVESMPQEDFVSLFARTFAPADLGLSGAHDLRAVAGDLHAGRAVQGRGDYQGLVVMAKSRPLGLFFLAGSGAVRELGFLGAVPAVRRRFALRAALAGGAAWMRADGISALTAEISTGNRRSLTLARRLGGAVPWAAPDLQRLNSPPSPYFHLRAVRQEN